MISSANRRLVRAGNKNEATTLRRRCQFEILVPGGKADNVTYKHKLNGMH